jgi:hypothetical protein
MTTRPEERRLMQELENENRSVTQIVSGLPNFLPSSLERIG